MIVVVIPAYKRLVLLLVVCRRWDFLIRHGRPPFLFTKTDEQNDENDQSEETNRERLRVKRRKLSSMTDRFCPVFLTVQRTIPEHILLRSGLSPTWRHPLSFSRDPLFLSFLLDTLPPPVFAFRIIPGFFASVLCLCPPTISPFQSLLCPIS